MVTVATRMRKNPMSFPKTSKQSVVPVTSNLTNRLASVAAKKPKTQTATGRVRSGREAK